MAASENIPDGDVQGGADGREAITSTDRGGRKMSAALTPTVIGTFPSDRRERARLPRRAVRYDDFLRDDRREKTIATQGRGETMNCRRCRKDQWGKSRDSFGREDIVCVNCGLS